MSEASCSDRTAQRTQMSQLETEQSVGGIFSFGCQKRGFNHHHSSDSNPTIVEKQLHFPSMSILFLTRYMKCTFPLILKWLYLHSYLSLKDCKLGYNGKAELYFDTSF